jgi:hypothetical protein
LTSAKRGQSDLQRGTLADMSEAERLKLAELVSSRVCESLIGPIGAVVNGIELLRQAPDRRATQTQIDRDCARIIDRLRFFRLAYGCDDDDLTVALYDLHRWLRPSSPRRASNWIGRLPPQCRSIRRPASTGMRRACCSMACWSLPNAWACAARLPCA